MKTNKQIIELMNSEYEKNPSTKHCETILPEIFLMFLEQINKKLLHIVEDKRNNETIRLFTYYNNRYNKINMCVDGWRFKKDFFIFWVIRECSLDSNLWGLHELLYQKFKEKIQIIKGEIK